MSAQTSKKTAHKDGDSGELKTDSPLSEKDEVKAAEERMARAHKKTAGKPIGTPKKK